MKYQMRCVWRSAVCGMCVMFLSGCLETHPMLRPLPDAPKKTVSPTEADDNDVKSRVVNSFPHIAPPETTKRLDIPLYGDGDHYPGKPFVYYTFAKQREQQLKLQAPELSQDDILIRIWWTHQSGLQQDGAVYTFTKNSGKWSGHVQEYTVSFNMRQFYERVSNVEAREFAPTRGWETFERLINECEIPTLKTCDHVENYIHWMREYFKENPRQALHTTAIEYATPETYRFYTYDSPQLIRDKVREAELFTRFLQGFGKLDSTFLFALPPGTID